MYGDVQIKQQRRWIIQGFPIVSCGRQFARVQKFGTLFPRPTNCYKHHDDGGEDEFQNAPQTNNLFTIPTHIPNYTDGR